MDFVYFDAGGGHRSAALALQSVMESGANTSLDCTVRLMNLQVVLDPLDVFRKVTGIRLEDIYNKMLAKGWTLGSGALLRLMHGVIRRYHSAQVKLLTEYWRRERPDLVVSLVPNFDRALFESLQTTLPECPFVTVLTDLADFPPHFWMERQPQQYFICGTDKAISQAAALNHPVERTFLTSGMILRPVFYEPQTTDRRKEREQLGLDPDLPTGIVLFGGEGSNAMNQIAQKLGNSSMDLQLILICGRNAKLGARLKELRTRNRLHVEGFTKRIPYFMHLADFLIGKPGPGSISEALHMNLPVIIESNAWTLPQERFNAVWVKENGYGLVLDSFGGIERGVRELLRPEFFKAAKERIGARENRAVFEVPALLSEILKTHGQTTGSAAPIEKWAHGTNEPAASSVSHVRDPRE